METSTTVSNVNGSSKQEEHKGPNSSKPSQDKGRKNYNRDDSSNNKQPRTNNSQNRRPPFKQNGEKPNNNNQNPKRGRYNENKDGGVKSSSNSKESGGGKSNPQQNKDGYYNNNNYNNRPRKNKRNPENIPLGKIKTLREWTNDYWGDDTVIVNALKENELDVDKAYSYLLTKRQGLWSNVVTKEVHTYQPPVAVTPPTSNAPLASSNPPVTTTATSNGNVPHQKSARGASKNTRRAGRKGTGNSTNTSGKEKQVESEENHQHVSHPATVGNEPVVEEEYNADAKIEALQKQFETELRGIEAKRQLLTSLKEEVASFTAERDSQIDTLTTEREQLCIKRRMLEQEFLAIQQRVEQIDLSVAQLKQEKVQKIRVLEEKSRAVLEAN